MTLTNLSPDRPVTGRVLSVEDDDNLREALQASLDDGGYHALVAADGDSALALLDKESIDLVISDVQMEPMSGDVLLRRIKRRYPELPVVLMTAFGTIQRAVDAMRCGAVHYLVKPFAADTLVETVRRHMPVLNTPTAGDAPIAADPKSKACLALARRVAASDATVLIHGDSGTGKEVYARYIHSQSARNGKPFVAINCAAIPESMLEAVLFGHEKGAFTGAATASAGKFEQAQNGTLLLDEISEMDLGLQAKLLRVLQEKEVERIGGQAPLTLNVRVLATTNRDLAEHVKAGRFREDLFYRLNVLPLPLPPLRERPGDIVPLATAFLGRSDDRKMVLTPPAVARLIAYDWPGNVRELDNVMQRAAILSPTTELGVGDLGIDLGLRGPVAEEAPPLATDATSKGALKSDLRSQEDAMILAAITNGSKSRKEVAESLGVSTRTLRYKLAKMRDAGIAVPDARGSIA